jgi:hypothetical protein
MRPTDAGAFHVPGMEDEVILPPSNNLSDKGRPMGAGARPAGRGPAPAAPARTGPRPVTSAGGPGVKVYGVGSSPPVKGILSGHGSLFIGTKGMIATVERGEGVWLLPAARWKEYVLPPPLLTRSPGHMADWIRACKGGDRSCSDFSVSAPFAEWLALASLALRVPGKLEWDSQRVRFTNSDEANKFVRPLFRKGWELKL